MLEACDFKSCEVHNTMNITTNEMKVSLKINKMVAGNSWVKENIKELEKLNYYKNSYIKV